VHHPPPTTQANYRELLPYGVLKSLLFYAFKEAIGVTGSILKMNVNNDFGLTLKNAVFKNILRQDVEFFDKKQSGVLQERLNADTAKLAGDRWGYRTNAAVHSVQCESSACIRCYLR
jgi:ABC-type multidrug transport system fused ATPase/permease subunit